MLNRTSLIVLVLAAALAGIFVGFKVFNTAPSASCPPTEALQCFATPRPLPPFELLRHDGSPLTLDALKGHWTLVFIGFTHCPDVCPTTLAELRQAQKQWQALPETTRPRVLFVSVDPERDSPAHTGRYAHAFHADTIAATGDLAALERFARSLSLVFMKQPPNNPQHPQVYAVDHSAALAVINPDGQMAGVIQPDPQSHSFDPDKIARDFILLSQNLP
ncbi:hypothetical protein CO615_00650 [Lysobacteraceae bacterium NML75-0749]|nr:hypothetical protein CO609_10050 [Xanthomonadaceae bacterium NML91-0268]PJK03583.1 hypothetical protein CO615_00650 [Xanthomonadaceae bacterium NML75-0749]